MKKWLSAGLVIAALVRSASASVLLDLRIRPYVASGSGSGLTLDYTGSSAAVTSASDVRTFVVEYRLTPTASEIIGGLCTVAFNIHVDTASGTALGSTVAPALLTQFQAATNGAASVPATSDTSGAADAPLAGVTGLHRPFRDAFTDPADSSFPGNGTPATIAGNGEMNSIIGLTINASGQGNPGAGSDPSGWFGLYSFQVSGFSGNGDLDIVASAIDPSTHGAEYAYFLAGETIPTFPPEEGWPVAFAPDASFTQSVAVPGPSGVGLLCLTAVFARRRRVAVAR